MSNLLKDLRALTAQRTGVPAQYDYEDSEQTEMRKGTWLVLLAVAIAFALALQMEADTQRNGKKTFLVGQQSSGHWEQS